VTLDQVTPGILRRVKVLANLSDEQLSRFLGYVEVLNLRQWADVVKQGAPGDGMYLILEGEVRVRMLISGKEVTLATLSPGDFFGEISLFDHGPRSADVVANTDVTLLKISVAAFQQLSTDAPDLATPFLLGIGKTLTGRIRADNKRYRESVSFIRAAGP
jgi:CRP-like cAMP-binding protein